MIQFSMSPRAGPVGPDLNADLSLDRREEGLGRGAVETRSRATAALPDIQAPERVAVDGDVATEAKREAAIAIADQLANRKENTDEPSTSPAAQDRARCTRRPKAIGSHPFRAPHPSPPPYRPANRDPDKDDYTSAGRAMNP
ncbi:hypothetical protein [Actinospica robiniae]|uniref:hypothetical protein n=1 Tax=Actinospica robiniae TaxID=304901 RepID=UPI00146FC672|nr:hypothetical protein [Actinospica robiniae]